MIDNETLKEVAVAAGEVAKTTGKAIDLAESSGKFFDRVMGDIVEDGLGLVRDRLKFYRFERAVLLAHETEKRLRDRGVTTTRVVPLKVALPLIEAASVEDEPDLMKLWAELLATAMDPGRSAVAKKFVSILQELTPDDAVLLAAIYSESAHAAYGGPYHVGGVIYRGGFDVRVPQRLSAISLYRIGVVAPAELSFDVAYGSTSLREERINIGERVTVPGTMDVVTLTALGIAFCEAVGMDKRPSERATAAA